MERGGLALAVRRAAHAHEAQAAQPPAEVPEPRAVDARGLALTMIAILALAFALHWGRTFFVSLLMGILIACALNPVVARLDRLRLPRWAGATLVMFILAGACAFAMVTLSGQVRAVLEQLPDAARKVSLTLSSLSGGEPGTLEKVQAAAREIEKATAEATGAPPVSKKVPAVIVEQPGFRVSSFLWANVVGAASLAGHAVMVFFLAFFLLLSGDTFKRKLVRLAGPTLSKRKVTVQAIDEINVSIQHFMFMLVATNALLAGLSWIAFRAVGLENAGAWAVAAGLLHVVPYVGSAVLAAALGISAFLQFGTYGMALFTVGMSLLLATVVGMAVATWMTGRLARMNSASVFVALLFWGWLWGVWGLLLAIPIIVTIKVASELIEPLHPVAELLRA